MARAEPTGAGKVEPWLSTLASKIHSRDLHALSIEEVETAYRAKAFADVWLQVTGTKLPEGLRPQMAQRLSRAGRLRDESAALPLSEGELPASAFLKAVSAGDLDAVRRGLECRDRLRLMGAAWLMINSVAVPTLPRELATVRFCSCCTTTALTWRPETGLAGVLCTSPASTAALPLQSACWTAAVSGLGWRTRVVARPCIWQHAARTQLFAAALRAGSRSL
ncbi:unnamed protein product [Polarella glacialis]|uniref:Uncharacterized protein n=1 Tax=Polarella glacialis TaxID=89957 RepID=A0A813DDL9_POLGL|nr:unnamed protein product [Polarella glacialis]